MSQYDDCSQRIFQDSQRQIMHENSSYSGGDFIDFNYKYSFGTLKIHNNIDQQVQVKHKQDIKDTNYTLRDQQEVIDNSTIYERKIRVIQTSSFVEGKYSFTKKGSPYQTMELNINFKTIFCRIVRNLALLKLLSNSEKELFLRYKSQSPSFKSLVKFLNSTDNKQSKNKIINIIHSSQVFKAILESEVTHENKLKMIKFIQIMRTAIISKNQAQKWKVNKF